MNSSKIESKGANENIFSDSGSTKNTNKSDNSTEISKNGEQIENNINKLFQNNLESEDKVKYTPILTYIKESSSNPDSEPDITQKIIIIYGIAAILYDIHLKDSTKVNVTPNYIFLDENLFPYIDIKKLNSDSKKQNADDFLLSNENCYPYYPPEAKNSENLISEDSNFRKKIDSYIYGSLVLSFMTKTVFDENSDLFDILDNSDLPENFQDSINSCLNDKQIYRPLFSDILYVIDSSDFLNDLTGFDNNRFKEYQKTVVSEEFIRSSDESDVDNLSTSGKIQIKIYSDKMFSQGRKIGKGMTCQVFRKCLKEDKNVVVAYKKLSDLASEEKKKRLRREIEILATVDHYAVQKLFGYIPGTAILTLFESNGSLQDVIDKKLPNFDFTQKYITMYGIVAGMYYLHKNGIAHRDLKTPNILMNDNLEPLICDFGLSKKVENVNKYSVEINANSIQMTGTSFYMPPEQYNAPINCFFAVYDAKLADVFSFSIIVYVLFTGQQPWDDEFKARESINEGRRPSIPDDFPNTIKLLIEACWVEEPKSRPTFEVILHMISHPIFIQNLGEEIDMDRFKEYQKKVVDESFLNDNILENHKIIAFNDIVFPEIPKEKIFSKDDFEEVSSIEKPKNPFLNVQLVKKDSLLFNRIDIKNEFFTDNKVISRLKTQIKVLLSIDHPSFNPLYGIISTPPKCQYFEEARDIYDIFPQNNIYPPSLIAPFLSKGSLVDNQSSLNITQKFIILYGVAAGMYYLHKHEMAHLNLKSENIFLNDDLEPIINIDIISRPKHERENLLNFLPLFSFSYVAPELFNFKDGHYTTFNEKPADVYSFAMVAYYLMSGIHPWDTSRGFQPILRKLNRNERPVTDNIIPAPFDKLIEDCWKTDPKERPSFKEILNRIGSESFIRSIELLDLTQFQNYQKKVVPDIFIFPIHICSIRKRDEFEFKKLIGQGSFGRISLYIDKTNNKEVVFKEIPEEHSDFVEQQIKILPVINFPSIISIYGFIKPEGDKKESVILTPYAKEKSLETFLKNDNKKSNRLDYTQKCIIMYGIAFGMYELHLHNIAHQNLKPQNVLINDLLEPWVTDFAISKFVDSNQSIFQTMSIDSAYYISPEAFFSKKNSDGNDYDEKLSDVYSFGLLVYYLMTGIKPFEATNNLEDLMERIKNGERPEIPEAIPSKMKKIITKCWDSDPSSRPSFYEILNTISNPDFYKLKKTKFDRQKFYYYQVKLGEQQFIKFNDENIEGFQLSRCSSIGLASSAHMFSSEILLKAMIEKYNNPELQYRLACLYRDGKGTDKDLNKAAEYFQKASDQNHVNATISLAICYKKGYGVPVNLDKANEMIQEAIKEGSIDALVILAKWYLSSYPRKYQEAMKLLQKADEKNHPDAAAIIGSLIEKKRVNCPNEDVIKLYKKSCYLGSYEGMYHMATHYHYGTSVDKNEAIRLYNLTLKNQNSNRNKALAVFFLSKLYEENKEFAKAFNLADHYRSKDKFVGYLLCSDFLKRGIGCEVNDKMSKEYYEEACQKRFIKEQIKFAILYHNGKGIKKNEEEFLRWTNIAAKNGSSIAQANLCRFYLNEEHKNHQLSEEFGIKSAESKNYLGYWYLSRLYKRAHNDEQELFYLKLSAESGSDKALVYMGMNFKRNKRNSEAIQKFKEASKRNNPSGIYHYGKELFLGKITTKNVQKGLKKIKEAADAGHRNAIKKLIEIYSKGLEGIDVDLKLSKKYEDKLDQLPKYSKH